MTTVHYPFSKFSFGSELEVADVPKRIQLPPELGSWEYCETDIVNTLPPYRGMAVDPAGVNPPVGGEVNTYPTRSTSQQIQNIMEIYGIFEKAGYPAQVSPVAETHFHVHVDGLREDIPALKRLTRYVKHNQRDLVDAVWGYYEHPAFKRMPKVKMFMKFDGGRLMPDWMADNIINHTRDFEHFLFLHAAGKDAVSRGRPFRYAVNMYCMKHTDTIEFRCFRASTDEEELACSLDVCAQFVYNALNDDEPIRDTIAKRRYKFPPMIVDEELMLSWANTKQETNLQGKNRKYYAV